jgi:hypothetical protein
MHLTQPGLLSVVRARLFGFLHVRGQRALHPPRAAGGMKIYAVSKPPAFGSASTPRAGGSSIIGHNHDTEPNYRHLA